jgi:hypothetical protein
MLAAPLPQWVTSCSDGQGNTSMGPLVSLPVGAGGAIAPPSDVPIR